MKKQLVTIVLLGAVATIWATIIYRVVAAYDDENEDGQVHAEMPTRKVVAAEFNLQPDTVGLKLKYRDPFTGMKLPDTNLQVAQKIRKLLPDQPSSAVKPSFEWPAVRYSGFITQSGGKIISVLSINGRTVILGEGETADQLTIIKNKRDSVKIRYKNHVKFIPRVTS